MDPIEIIARYYEPGSRAYNILVSHSRSVAEKAVAVAENVPHLNPDIEFIREAAMLHDIGIFKTSAAGLGCTGDAPYICHGIFGRQILESEGLFRHSLVCERHVGVGITSDEISFRNLPLPKRDMGPESIE